MPGPTPANSYVRVRGLSPKMALSDGHVVAPGAWAVPVASLEALRVLVPAGLTGRHTVDMALVAIDGGVLAHTQISVVVAPGVAGDRASPPSGLGVRPARPHEARVGNPGAAETVTPAPQPGARLPQRLAMPPPPAQPAAPTPPPSGKALDGALASAGGLAAGGAVAALPPETPAPPAVPPPPVASETRPGLPPAELARATGFLERGRKLLAEGNVASARLFLERAADAGLADGAMAMAETYDPRELSRHGAVGIQPDAAEARRWYEKARDLGAGAAAIRRLERLGQR
jgi:hypothetical protein